MSEFTTIVMKLNTRGKKTAPIIGPLMGDVRDWGDGKDKEAMLSLPTSEFQDYFDVIDKLKERLGFADENTTLRTAVKELCDALEETMDVRGHTIDNHTGKWVCVGCGTFLDEKTRGANDKFMGLVECTENCPKITLTKHRQLIGEGDDAPDNL